VIKQINNKKGQKYALQELIHERLMSRGNTISTTKSSLFTLAVYYIPSVFCVICHSQGFYVIKLIISPAILLRNTTLKTDCMYR